MENFSFSVVFEGPVGVYIYRMVSVIKLSKNKVFNFLTSSKIVIIKT